MVTHPFHPLRGERLDVLFVCCRGAGRVYVCDGGRLGGMALPEDATDRGPESAERSLCLEALVELASVVAALLGEQGMER